MPIRLTDSLGSVDFTGGSNDGSSYTVEAEDGDGVVALVVVDSTFEDVGAVLTVTGAAEVGALELTGWVGAPAQAANPAQINAIAARAKRDLTTT